LAYSGGRPRRLLDIDAECTIIDISNQVPLCRLASMKAAIPRAE
jgi:hypothetical protein